MQKILEGNFFYKDRHHLYRKKKKKDGANQICNQRKKNDPNGQPINESII